jgi:hypothetical protein
MSFAVFFILVYISYGWLINFPRSFYISLIYTPFMCPIANMDSMLQDAFVTRIFSYSPSFTNITRKSSC